MAEQILSSDFKKSGPGGSVDRGSVDRGEISWMDSFPKNM